MTAPRVCIVSQRGIAPALARCCAYEFEDVICQVTEADLITAREQKRSTIARRFVKAIGKRMSLAARLPTFETIAQLEDRYDILLCVCQSPADLVILNSVRGWRSKCRYAVCWLEEFWSFTPTMYRGFLKRLRLFDRVFVNCHCSVDLFARTVGIPCEYSPPGVDALRFGRGFDACERSIDVLNLGRRSEGTHRALLEWARRNGRFYLFDTIKSKERVSSHDEHRELLGSLIRRSHFFIANRAKFNFNAQTSGQAEVGFRFFEGPAGGAVLIGDPPRGEAFDTHLNWEDSVIPVSLDEPRIGEIIEELERDPARLEAIRHRNVINISLRHDWLFRWGRIMESLDLAWSPAMHARLRDLFDLASSAGAEPQQLEDRRRALAAVLSAQEHSEDAVVGSPAQPNGQSRPAGIGSVSHRPRVRSPQATRAGEVEAP